MNKETYEKVVTGRSLVDIFGKKEKLDIVESYLVHVETVDGTGNNYIENSKSGHRELTDFYVSSADLSSLKLV